MGQSISVPERIHRAAKQNDIGELQALCRDMRMNRSLDAASKQAMLNWTDDQGRTALMWASQKNHLHVAQMLLEEGANVHPIAPMRPNGGSALAEAIAGKHEALVELLLRFGADPFTENSSGKTPLDMAAEARAVHILRACERQALFAGYVSTRVGQLKGFSYTSKDRWVVIVPRFTPPAAGCTVGEVRAMMLLFRNAGEADARTKVWLDGASISVSGGEALLRLHPNHVQPRNIYSQYNSGWIMFFQPARAQGSVPPGGVHPQRPDAAFAALLATASRPLEQLQQQQQVRMATAAAMNPWVHGTPSASLQVGTAPSHAGHTGSSGYWSQPALQQPYMHAGLQMQPQAAPPSASYQQQPQYGASDAGISAHPGESDEAFAQRLASMYGSSPAGSMSSGPASATAPLSAAGSTAPSRLASATSQPRPPAQGAGQDSSNNPFAQQTQLPQASDNPFRAHSAGTPSQQQQQQPPGRMAGVLDAGVPSAPSDPSPAAAAAPVPAAARPAAPAAATAAAAVSVGGEVADLEGPDADQCVICLSAPREVGLLHGASVHKCLCKECAPMVRVGTACPMCRQTVERVLGVF